MSDFQNMKKKKLRKLVAETEETLAEIKAELALREENAQEQELEHLDEHFQNAELNLQTIRNFFVFIREELKKK